MQSVHEKNVFLGEGCTNDKIFKPNEVQIILKNNKSAQTIVKSCSKYKNDMCLINTMASFCRQPLTSS